jgi:hypothetical protein
MLSTAMYLDLHYLRILLFLISRTGAVHIGKLLTLPVDFKALHLDLRLCALSFFVLAF